MYHPRHLNTTHRRLVVAAVAVVLVAAVLVVATVSRDSPDAQPSRPHPAGGRLAGATSADPAAVLSACAGTRRTQAPALRTAAATLAQWRVHVEAMNALVAGRITFAQATAFWNRTRVGAARRVAAFEAAAAAAGTDPGCHRVRVLRAAVSACVTAVRTRAATLAAARVAVATWQHHIVDMERLRAGRLSPARALRMWIMSWHKGVRQLDAYRAAVRRDHRAEPACP